MRLVDGLRLAGSGGRPVRLALSGAGGKTTAMFALARQLQQQSGKPVLVSTTTHLGIEQADLADRHQVLADIEPLSSFPPGVTLLTGPAGPDGRLAGLPPDVMEAVRAFCDREQLDFLLEADGSRLRPLKAPAAHEPAIPAWVEQVLVVAGLQALGQPLDETWAHRHEIYARLAGIPLESEINSAAIARVLAHPQGGLKGIPPGARRTALLNGAGTPERQAAAQRIAETLLSAPAAGSPGDPSAAYASVLTASFVPGEPTSEVIAVYERIAGIVLAAGKSERLGRPKQLLDWQGQPFVRQVALTALQSGLSPVVVVTGAYSEAVSAAVADLPVHLAYNPNWEAGQSTSLQAGLQALPPETGAVFFLLSDQPQVPASILSSLAAQHHRSLGPIIAPLADGRRANPVLFDRATFPDLLALQGDTGGRALFSHYRVEWLPWHDASLLLDVDTEEDYQQLLRIGGDGIAS